MMLTKEQIRTVNDRRSIDVEVPEWGGMVRLRSMDAADRIAYEAFRSAHAEAVEECAAFLLIRCAVDETGARLFADEDVAWLKDKHRAVLVDLVNRASKLNVLDRADVEETRKNFSSGPNGDSRSSSPSISAA